MAYGARFVCGEKGAGGFPEKPSDGAVLSRAIRACLTDTDFISAGQCDMMEYILRDLVDFEVGGIRVAVWRAPRRTVVYLLNVYIRILVCLFRPSQIWSLLYTTCPHFWGGRLLPYGVVTDS